MKFDELYFGRGKMNFLAGIPSYLAKKNFFSEDNFFMKEYHFNGRKTQKKFQQSRLLIPIILDFH
jgi:hypothetical protein